MKNTGILGKFNCLLLELMKQKKHRSNLNDHEAENSPLIKNGRA
jgi:hypothetical protein